MPWKILESLCRAGTSCRLAAGIRTVWDGSTIYRLLKAAQPCHRRKHPYMDWRMRTFDEIDFAARPWLPVSGWPITRSDIQPALERAATLLNLGPNIYDERLLSLLRLPPEEIGLDRDRLRSFFWQFSHERATSGEPMRFVNISRQLKAPNVDFLTRATVTEINLNNDGRCVNSLEAYSLEGNKAIVRAKTIVLCCGGIENARLLLASNSLMTNGIGNSKGIVGRYLADHPRTSLARFNGVGIDEIARHFNFFGLRHNGRTHFYLRGLSLSPDTQMREGLTNCAAYPVQVHRADDPWAALKRLRHGFSQKTLGDLIAVFGAINLVASGLYRRIVQKHGLPHRSVELRFDAMVEQRLDAESRVTLSDRRDRFGKPLPRVDWKIGSVEIESMKRLALLISDEFPRVGLPRPHLADWIAQDDNSKMACTDMAHLHARRGWARIPRPASSMQMRWFMASTASSLRAAPFSQQVATQTRRLCYWLLPSVWRITLRSASRAKYHFEPRCPTPRPKLHTSRFGAAVCVEPLLVLPSI